jgi:hypothetical protein
MKGISRILAGAAIVAVLDVVALPALSQTPTVAPIKRAPAPIAGASLPILAVGFGVYWLVRRYRRKAE